MLDALELAETDPDQALAQLQRLSERYRGAASQAFIMTERAALLLQTDQTDAARAEMAVTLEGRPPDFAPRLRRLYATTLLLEEDYLGALRQLEYWAEHVVDLHPGGLFLMGYTLVRLERYAEAVQVLERTLASASTARPPWVELLAYAYTETGQPDKALALIAGLIEERPDQARWWRQLAGALILLERIPAGTASLTLATEFEAPSLADGRRLARLFAHIGAPIDGAELLAGTLKRTSPEDGAPSFDDLMLLGELWLRAREEEQAIATFHQAQAVGEDGEALLMIGQIHAQRERFDAASEALREAAELYGEAAPGRLYYLLAVIELNLGSWTSAARAIDQLLADDAYRRQGEQLESYLQARMSGE